MEQQIQGVLTNSVHIRTSGATRFLGRTHLLTLLVDLFVKDDVVSPTFLNMRLNLLKHRLHLHLSPYQVCLPHRLDLHPPAPLAKQRTDQVGIVPRPHIVLVPSFLLLNDRLYYSFKSWLSQGRLDFRLLIGGQATMV